MPVVGNRASSLNMGQGYQQDPMSAMVAKFKDVAQGILNESGVDMFKHADTAVMRSSSNEAMKNFFMEQSADPESMTALQYEDHMCMMEEQYENDKQIVKEYASMGGFNPVIGMTFPLHKNILMNNIFDKGAIPKFVAREPKFTISMETRILTTPDGTEIDMFKEQYKMKAAIMNTAPIKDTIIDLPENETTDVLAKTFGATRTDDNLSIESNISAVLVESYCEIGDTYYDVAAKANAVVTADPGVKPVWFTIPAKRFAPSYGTYDRTLMDSFAVTVKTLTGSVVGSTVVTGTLSGYTKKNMFMIQCNNTAVVKVKLSSRIDTSSAMLRTCSVAWKVRTDIIEIPNAIPINVPISPEEVKDIGALYQVNQLTKVMSLLKTVMGNYKDDLIHDALDTSFLTMEATNKLQRTFDFAPREGYMLDHLEWRHKTFMDALDTHVTSLFQVLNDPNMTITIFGRPDLIRKITPTEYTYQSPSSIGPVELDFVKTITTSDKRTYQFISSDKMRGNNNLIIILCPRNTDRIIYRIYDYQLYVSNEIRNAVNYALPAIHAFERWKFVEYQPVQARLKIINPTGLREWVDNTDPIGTNAMTDAFANYPEGYVPTV